MRGISDASGAGELTTCSKAVYDTSIDPPKLVGVVGVDVLVSDLKSLGAGFTDEEALIEALHRRSTTCGAAEPTECGLLKLRTKSFEQGAQKDTLVEGVVRRLRLCDGDSLDLVDTDICNPPGTSECRSGERHGEPQTIRDKCSSYARTFDDYGFPIELSRGGGVYDVLSEDLNEVRLVAHVAGCGVAHTC